MKKAGMNAEDFHKYIEKSILPLYPDVEDKPGKRVFLKVDSGPGHMNVKMLAGLKIAWCLCNTWSAKYNTCHPRI